MVALFGFGRSKDPRQEPRFKDPSELQRLIDEKNEPYHLVDVRTTEEYLSGHIPTAVQTTHTEIGQTPPTDDREARIIVYCRSGSRSEHARNVLLAAGYRNVTNFGGVIDWPGRLVEGDRPE